MIHQSSSSLWRRCFQPLHCQSWGSVVWRSWPNCPPMSRPSEGGVRREDIFLVGGTWERWRIGGGAGGAKNWRIQKYFLYCHLCLYSFGKLGRFPTFILLLFHFHFSVTFSLKMTVLCHLWFVCHLMRRRLPRKLVEKYI